MLKIPEKVGGLPVLFIATVLIPTLIATVYFSIKSDIYSSESRFVVKSSEKQPVSGLGSLLKTSGISVSEEGYAANDYILSRDALAALNRDGLVQRAYGNPDISFVDRFNPFGSTGGSERLFNYYEDKITVKHDAGTGITTLKVDAYDPADAQRINVRLLDQAEALVNRMNKRGRDDGINYANRELAEAKDTARNAAVALSVYRNREGIVDPDKQATVQLQMISKLQDEMIATKTQLVQLRSLTPQNPQIPVLATRITELNREIGQQLGQVAGDQKSLAASAVEFERLQLESQLADKQLGAAIASLQEAKNDSRRKRAYVERIVDANLPDHRSGPKRLRGILNVLVVGLVLWGILSMVLSGLREHTD